MKHDFVEYFKDVKYGIDIECFKKSELKYNLAHNLKASLNLGPNPFLSEIEYYSKVSTMIISELNQQIVKTIFKYIFDNGKKSFINLSDDRISSLDIRCRKILSKINIDVPQKYLIINGRIASDYFMDSSNFVNLPFTGKSTTGGLVYPIGSLQLMAKREIWIDPFMRYDDNHILCFDEVRIDVSNFRHSMQTNQPSFSPQILVELDLKYEVLNPEVFFILEDGNMKNWDLIKAEIRESRIDYIIDGSKESRQDSQFGFHFDDKLEP